MNRNKDVLLLFGMLVCIAFGAAAQRQAANSAPSSQRAMASSTDLLLDGNDWRMGSFAFDAGEAQGAAQQNFDDSAFRSVTVPGDTQIQAGFTGVERFRESKELLAVNQKEWWYRKQFHAGPQQPGNVSRIVFDGSDYFTTVWLNGKLLGSHEGTFTSFSFDVTNLLRYDGENLLAVKVTHPWVPKDRSMEEFLGGNFDMAQPWALPVLSKPPYYIDVRWDALPAQGNAAFPMGIWRSIHLQTTGALDLKDLHALTVSIDKDGSALLRLSATVENAGSTAESRQINLLLKPDNFNGPPQKIPPLTIRAIPGETMVTTEVRVPHAQLWWSWDEGPQNLYDLDAGIGPANNEAQRSVRFGIRTVTRSADMAYHVNGAKLFIKASWFPIEDMYRSTPTAHDYERDLRLFRDANYNMLVNFTVVEKPEFYDLCDELGLLVVTELPFEQFGPQQVMDKDSPRREPFMQQVRLQVPQIVKALRSHPSIIEWAPMAEAHDKDLGKWGLNTINPDQAGYDTFVATIKAITDELSPDTIFHASLCDLGEQHFWMAEAGARYIESNYQEHFDAQAGFISEFGSISLTSVENLGKYLTPEQQWGFKAHKSRLWFNLPIDTTAYAYWTAHLNDGLYSMLYRTIHFIDAQPRSAGELVQDTQLYQAFLMRYASEAYRRKKYEPVNGIRSWDYLELSPGFRMGILDYDRVPKTAYWYMKHVQAPLSISFAYKEALESQLAGTPWSAPVWVINDFHHEVHGTLHTELVTTGGQTIAATDNTVTIPSDGKLMATTFALTLPQAPGVYVLHAKLTTTAAAEPIEETSFIKVVPTEFTAPHRVLLLAQKKYAAPIRTILEGLGFKVDLYDENSIDIMARDLSDASALHRKYDVVWLGSFEAIAKVLPPQSGKAIAEAVKLGTGFIHTGGIGSFHGGQGHAAVLEATSLADILPVTISGREDTVYGGHSFDDVLKTETGFKDITSANKSIGVYPAEGLDLLRRFGVVAFNQVTAIPGSDTQLSVAADPLLVTGSFGAGKTVAFTGFTPQTSDNALLPVDQYLMAEPQTRAFFVLFGELLADVLPHPQESPAKLLAIHDKPLFETLKELPQTRLTVTAASPAPADPTWTHSMLHIVSKGNYTHLVHMRIEWKDNASRPYVFEFSDNDFELFQQQSKDIELRWRGVDPTHAGGFLIVSAANSAEIRIAL